MKTNIYKKLTAVFCLLFCMLFGTVCAAQTVDTGQAKDVLQGIGVPRTVGEAQNMIASLQATLLRAKLVLAGYNGRIGLYEYNASELQEQQQALEALTNEKQDMEDQKEYAQSRVSG